MLGSSDENLIAGLLAQDKILIEELYARMRPPATKIILRLGGQKGDVDDILQEAIIALYLNLTKNQFQQHSQVKLSSYILQIVKFQWLNNRNKSYRKKEEPLEFFHDGSSDIDIQKDLENLERNQQLRKIIDLLPSKCQTIFEMFYWEKKSMSEIANQLSITKESVKNAKYRCMKKAKDLYNNSNAKIEL